MSEESREKLRRELGGGMESAVVPVVRAPISPPVLHKPLTVTLKHNDRCPALRNDECTCAANLQWLADSGTKAIEVKVQEWVEVIEHRESVDAKGKVTPRHTTEIPHRIELWKVDGGKSILKMVPAVTGSTGGRQLEQRQQLPPRWVCTSCGWACRGSAVSHRCDKAAVSLATRQQTLAELLTPEQRFNGQYRLIIWRDQDQKYHVGEEFIEEGRVVKAVTLWTGELYDEMEGVLCNEIVERFAP